jgi:hypothetical protein
MVVAPSAPSNAASISAMNTSGSAVVCSMYWDRSTFTFRASGDGRA